MVGSTPGFVTFPSGSFAAAANAKVTTVPGSPYPSTWIYDRPVARWLTVPWSWVSSGGAQFVYRAGDGSIHIAAASGANDRALVAAGTSPSGGGWFPIGITAQSIYIAAGSHLSGPAPAPFYGVWSVNLDGSHLKAIAPTGVYTTIGIGAAWGIIPQIASSLNRLDLSSGSSAVWYAPPNSFISLYDIDASGNPVLSVTSSDQSSFVVGLVTAQNTLTKVDLPATTSWVTSGHFIQSGLAAHAGIWLTSQDGSILFAPNGAKFEVMTIVTGATGVAAGCD